MANNKSSQVIKTSKLPPPALRPGSVLKIPKPRIFHQLVLFVLDGSGSMTLEGKSGKAKGEEVNEAIHATLDRLRNSKNSNCFDVGALAFSSDFEEILAPTPVEQIPSTQSFDPTELIENERTYAFDAMKHASITANAYLTRNQGKNAQALIFLMSDGILDDFADVLGDFGSKSSREDIFIATLYFKTKWTDRMQELFDVEDIDEKAVETLRDLASCDKNLFHIELDVDKIRDAMIQSISFVSKT